MSPTNNQPTNDVTTTQSTAIRASHSSE